MTSMKRILVGVDLADETDKQLIEYLSFISAYLQPSDIYFLHIEEDLEVPEELLHEFPDLKTPYDESLEQKMGTLVHEHGEFPKGTNLHFDVVEGEPFKELLHRAHVKEVDLITTGKKLYQHASRLMPQKIARQATCSTLIVSNRSQPQLKKVLVPVDFSEHSKKAMEAAIDLMEPIEGGEIICQHVYAVPTGYYKLGKSFDEFAETMKGHGTKKMESFLAPFQDTTTPIRPCYTLREKGHLTDYIYQAADQEEADLILAGSKGQTRAAHMLLGSTTENLITTPHPLPLFIVKEKGENVNFLKALLQI